VLLDVLLDRRNVTHAAERVCLSQPAMSRALGRLRRLMDDPLLVKGTNGLMPTAKATWLQPRLKKLLAEIEELLADTPFEPASIDGMVTLAANDYQTIALLPRLMARLAREAPKLTVKVVPLFDMSPEKLHDGSVDLVFGIFQEDLPAGLCQIELPVPCPPIQTVVIWSKVMDTAPINQWLRYLVQEEVIPFDFMHETDD
jgi:DNA-binding transcriptional LysR family regulator